MKRCGAGIVIWMGGLCLVAARTDDAPSAPAMVELPIKLRHGDLFVETSVNKSKPLAFKVDTGFGITTIHPDLVGQLNLRRNGHLDDCGNCGRRTGETYGGAAFDFGGLDYEPRRVPCFHPKATGADGIAMAF